MHPNVPHHLHPNLREVCVILAAGLVRLTRHSSEDVSRDLEQVRSLGECSLHFTDGKSGHATTKKRD
jgi:hypothetical protein